MNFNQQQRQLRTFLKCLKQCEWHKTIEIQLHRSIAKLIQVICARNHIY